MSKAVHQSPEQKALKRQETLLACQRLEQAVTGLQLVNLNLLDHDTIKKVLDHVAVAQSHLCIVNARFSSEAYERIEQSIGYIKGNFVKRNGR